MKDSPMDDRSSKLYFGFCMLVLIWIGVYWAWEPDKSTNPKISIAQPRQPIALSPEPTPTTFEPTTPESSPQEQPQEQQTLTLPIVPPTSKPTLTPPQFTTHTIKQGQVLQDIAEIYYGQTNMWHVIARANPTVDPLKLRAGRTLRIPKDPNNIQGLVQFPVGSSSDNPTPESQTVEYLVQPGDSLSKIAQNYYGSARHADFIYQSNRDTLRSMDAIAVGQTLKLPPLDP